MFAKKSFNPSTIRIFSFILAGIVLIVINVLLSGFAMNKVYRYTENKFLENYSLNSDGYAKSVEQILSKYISPFSIILTAITFPLLQKKTFRIILYPCTKKFLKIFQVLHTPIWKELYIFATVLYLKPQRSIHLKNLFKTIQSFL